MFSERLRNTPISNTARLSFLCAVIFSLPATADDTANNNSLSADSSTRFISTPAQNILNTKLLNAAMYEDFDQVKGLMSKGAQSTVKHPWMDYHTPLTAALASGFAPIARYMLDNDKSEPTERALFYGARVGDLSIVKTILERLTTEDSKSGKKSRLYGRCELSEAVKHGRLEVAQLLYPLQIENCSASIETGIKGAHLPVVKWLLTKQTEEEKANNPNQTQWMRSAFASGDLDTIRFVQDLGVKLDGQVDFYAATAARNDQIEIFKYLTSQGFKFDTNPNVYSNVLRSAVGGGATSVLDHLISEGVSLNKPGACSPPLHNAVSSGKRALFFKLAKFDTPMIDSCSLQNPMHIAFSRGNTEENLFLLDYNPEWRLAKDSDGNIPLHIAVRNNADKAVPHLLNFGGENAQNAQGQTPLMLSMQAQDAKLHEYFLLSDLSLTDNQGKTVLHYLTERWSGIDLENYKALFAELSKQQINAKNFSGDTPLNSAISNWNQADFIAKLIELGADPTIPNQSGTSAIDLANRRGDFRVLAALGIKPTVVPADTTTVTDTTEPNTTPAKVAAPIDLKQFPTSQGNTALHAAVRARSAIAVDYVLQNDIPIDSQNQFGDTALQLAIKIGEPRLVERLMKAGAKINTKNRDGRTPLHTAIANKRLVVANKLLQQNTDLNALSRGDWTPLHFAAVNGDQTLVNELLKQGANPSSENWGDNTPAMLAKNAGHNTVAERLQAAQIPPARGGTDAFGNNLLMRAVQSLDIDEVNNQLNAAQLSAQNRYSETPLSMAIRGSNDDEQSALAILQALLKSGADIEKVNHLGSSALYYAIREKAPNSVTQLLLDAGAEIDTQDKFGIAAIEVASRSGNTQLVSQLLDKKPELLSRQFSEGQNLLHIATTNKHPELMQLLIDKGIDVNAVGQFEFTALDTAIVDKQDALVRILVNAGADVQRHPSFYPSMVITAAKNGEFETLEFLVDNGAKLDSFEASEPRELLRILADNGDADSNRPQLIDKVIQKYELFKKPGFLDANQRQLLNQVIQKDAVKILAVYQKNGMSIHLKGALHSAVNADAIKVAKHFSESLTDLNQLNNQAQSLLHTAVKSSSMKVTEWLSQQTSLNINLRDDRDSTAMDYIADFGKYGKDDIEYASQFLTLFPNAKYNPNLLEELIDLRRYKVAKLLLEQRDFPVAESKEKLTQSIIQSRVLPKDSVALIEKLLAKGAVLPTFEAGRSALLTTLNQPELFDFLLSKQTTIPSEKEQWDVLSSLVRSENEGSLGLLKSLQSKGWNLKTTSEDGRNLLHRLNGDFYSNDVNQKLVLGKFDYLLTQLGGQQALHQADSDGETPLQVALSNNRLFEHIPELFERQIEALPSHPKPMLKNMVWLFYPKNLPSLKRLIKIPALKQELIQISLPSTVKGASSAQSLKDTVPFLISLGADPKAVDSEGKSLVYDWMSSCGWDPSVCLAGLKYLKTLAVDFSLVSNEKISPLHLAMKESSGNNLEIVNFLLAQGVSPNIKLPNGETPLHLAAPNTQAEQRLLLKALLQAGADINAQNNEGDTPFHLALRNRNTAGINYLLSAGNLKNIENAKQQTPLHELVKLGNANWVKRYLEIITEQNSTLSQQDIGGDTALHTLALQTCTGSRCNDNAAIGKLLLDSGVTADTLNKNDETAFYMTAYSGNLALAKLLKSKTSASAINQLNRVGNAPVHVAYYQKHITWMEWLLANGGDWNLKNWEGQSIQQLMVDNQDYPLALLAQSLPITAFDWKKGLADFELSAARLNSPALLYSMMDQRRIAVEKLPEISLNEMVSFRDESSKNTLLHIASQNDYLFTVNQLLKAHHPVDWLNEYQETALHLAIGDAAPEVAKSLLSHGAGPNMQNPRGVSPLLKAVRNNKLEVVKSMLKMGANTEITDLQQRTALLVAVETGKLDMVALLLENGADINAVEQKTHSPLVHAVWHYVTQMNSDPAELQNRMALVDLLLANGADINSRDELDRTPLHIAMPIYQLAQHLLAKGANADTKNSNNEAPFFQAIRTRYPGESTGTDFIRAMVKAGADVNETNKDGVTPLHLAVSNNRLDLIPVLTELGADVNMRIRGVPLVSQLINQRRYTAQALITELLKHQLNLNVHDNVDGQKGKTPLHHAFDNGNFNVARFLLENGSNPALQDKSGMNALHVFIRIGNSLSDEGRNSLIAEMVRAGLDLNAVDYDNRTALHHAARSGNLALTKMLLAKGIDPNAQSIGDYTALLIAVEKLSRGSGNTELVDELIKVTDLNIRDVNGRTVLHWAYAANDERLVKQLIDAGIDVTIRDYQRRLAQD